MKSPAVGFNKDAKTVTKSVTQTVERTVKEVLEKTIARDSDSGSDSSFVIEEIDIMGWHQVPRLQ